VASHMTQDLAFQFLDEVTKDIQDPMDKRWLTQALASHLRRFAFSSRLLCSNQQSVRWVNQWQTQRGIPNAGEGP